MRPPGKLHWASASQVVAQLRKSGWNDFKGGLRAGIRTFACAFLETLRDALVVNIDNAIRVELVYLRADLRADPVAAARRLIDYNLQSLNHSTIFSRLLSAAAAIRSSGTKTRTRTSDDHADGL